MKNERSGFLNYSTIFCFLYFKLSELKARVMIEGVKLLWFQGSSSVLGTALVDSHNMRGVSVLLPTP